MFNHKTPDGILPLKIITQDTCQFSLLKQRKTFFVIFMLFSVVVVLSCSGFSQKGLSLLQNNIYRRARDNSVSLILHRVQEDIRSFFHAGQIHSLSAAEAKALAEAQGNGVKTEFGSYAYETRVRSRSAPRTYIFGSDAVRDENLNPIQEKIAANIGATLDKIRKYMQENRFYHVKGHLGSNPEWTPECNLFVSAVNPENVRLVHMVAQTLFEEGTGKEKPNYTIVYIPEWPADDLQILRFPETGVTFILGSDYYGEAKKGFLTQDGWNMKQGQGRLSLHAGARMDYVLDAATGKIKRVGTFLLGLSATGKTTLTVHGLGFDQSAGERSLIVQDDFISVLVDPGARPDRPLALGNEDGFYLKTDGLKPKEQPLIWAATTQPSAIFENIAVDSVTGEVDFDKPGPGGTTNQRGIMKREALVLNEERYFTEDPNMPALGELDEINIIFITRQGTIIPPISKLTLEQAAAFFMLGESVHSSASTQKQELWGQPVNEVGTNPFIVGSQAEEGNIFYAFLQNLSQIMGDRVNTYLVNTGKIGENVKIGVYETTTILRETLRGSVEWQEDLVFGTLVPASIPGLDMSRFNPAQFYSTDQITQLALKKYEQRQAWLARFPELNPAILNALRPPRLP